MDIIRSCGEYCCQGIALIQIKEVRKTHIALQQETVMQNVF